MPKLHGIYTKLIFIKHFTYFCLQETAAHLVDDERRKLNKIISFACEILEEKVVACSCVTFLIAM